MSTSGQKPVQSNMNRLDLWIGIECTFNRVRETYLNQLEVCGHHERLDDLNLLSTLGAKCIRYPVLWEQVAPESLEQLDWSWTDARLERLRELDMQPIATLLHHGSGPRYTSLLDPEFPEKLAVYAGQVARRYPWLRTYTPVNEPLTTARFSGLYGIWYPHHATDDAFVRMLLNECRGTVLAMRAIREVQPEAQLIQTEDLAKVHATPAMQPQADFQNHRRWLAYDLLCGLLDETHPLWDYLTRSGATAEELLWFRENPCPPDVIGVDYYLTSERFLDERRERYLAHHCNDTHADIEAVRVYHNHSGIKQLLRETWERYGLPIAVTEAHLGSSREEQLRWFEEIWQAAEEVKAEGVDMRAVTSWAALGSYDWNILHTEFRGYYEPGAFDVRSPVPRPTALAKVLRARAQGVAPEHPSLVSPGFWRRPDRFFYPPVGNPGPVPAARGPVRPLLILGTGRLGQVVARLCHDRGLDHRLLSPADIDITNQPALEALFEAERPWAVINTLGYGKIDQAELEHQEFWLTHSVGAALLAQVCERRGVQLLTFSSDQVFGGDGEAPYHELDVASPVNVYGRAKLESERQVLANHPTALIVRSSAVFGSGTGRGLLSEALRTLQTGETVLVDQDHRFSPTYLPDLVHTSLDLLIDGESGVWHLVNTGESTWAEMVGRLAHAGGLPDHRIRAASARELGWVAPRPRYSALRSDRAQLLPSLDHALDRYLDGWVRAGRR
ncbi:family 1 glycosylhydrolase [Deinococcus deserti]|uniref:dTDP-4-dehydrorhamnose reductase n=1 Tax=Deinococcus deserti (strain DSM 17065 / CIP 109153 / LMG 22923 / VCD115) TaxID=546414 RepID=C1D2Q2_DEIDV|nr:family 1 glycosylhydrolase [Deinococcus deserti]ACO47691.1 putative bifunctional protein: glycosyl hydrolase family 1; dTDP-4-dehydrorhamnose reductase [Deinococcus deserti VCD115]